MKRQGNYRDLTGQRFGRLVALRRVNDTGRARWECLCDCGKIKVVSGNAMQQGSVQSCRCLHAERASAANKTHGHTVDATKTGKVSPTYYSWIAMWNRVQAKSGNDFFNYKLRGITVCERWEKFDLFLADMGPRPEGMTLDRINNDKGYEPGNCRWATRLEQTRNRRSAAQCRADREKALQILKKGQAA